MLNLKSNDGNKVSGGYTVYWYEGDTDDSVGIGSTLHNVEAGKSYQYQIVLGEELSYQYMQPEMGTVTAQEGDSSVDVILEPIRQISISGTVKDTDGKVIDGARLKVKQTFNGKYEKVTRQSADEKGRFNFSVANVDMLVTVSADNCYNSIYKVMPENVKDGVYTIDVVLRAMPQSKIELSLSMQYAAAPGETAKSGTLLSADSMEFTLFDETQGQEIRNFEVQYPYLIIGEDFVNEGDDVRISAIDGKGQMTAEDVTVKLDEDKCGSAFISFVQNGSIMIESITGNKENLVMVFDDTGKLVQSGNAVASYAGKPLAAGKYDVIIIKKSTFCRNILNMETLADLGLVEKTDYVKKSVTVSNGKITVIDSVALTQLDESRLYYTVSDKTFVAAGQSTTVAGRYVTVRAQYEIDSKYASSNEKVRIEIPEGMSFVEGSFTINGKKATYSREGNSITASVNKSNGTVRFYLLATDVGNQDIQAFLSFKKDGGSVQQPIGSASVEVTAAKITVPEKTGRKSVTVSGKAVADCKVTVYDNGESVGETVSNKNGSWSMTFDLVKPLNYSYHSIYTVISDSRQNINIQTETAGLIYEMDYAEPAKVTMYNNTNQIVFDFLNPSAIVPSYSYASGAPTFTFKAEFTGGDAGILDDVYVVTMDASGDETYVKCTYDSVTGTWIGTHDYKDFSDVPCSVTVSYDYERMEQEFFLT